MGARRGGGLGEGPGGGGGFGPPPPLSCSRVLKFRWILKRSFLARVSMPCPKTAEGENARKPMRTFIVQYIPKLLRKKQVMFP